MEQLLWETVTAVPQEGKQAAAPRPGDSKPSYRPTGTEKGAQVSSSTIHNSQKVERTQTSIKG